MKNERRGGWRTIGARRYMRVRIGAKKREVIPLPACRTDEEADARCAIIADVAEVLIAGGRVDRVKGFGAQLGAATTEKEIAAIRKAVDHLVKTENVPPKSITFEQLAERWTSGALAKTYPDYVKVKDSSDDSGRLKKYVNGIIGPIPLVALKESDCARVMTSLPEGLAPATRRHVAQIVHRVLELAVFPCRILDRSPLPRGFLPKLGPAKAAPYLYPKEDAKLLACTEIPLARRLVYGILAREGMRASELIGNAKRGIEPMTWSDTDTEAGIFHLDENKTDDPRSWAMDQGVRAALKAWKKMHPKAQPSDVIATVPNDDRLAETLRADLVKAGVDREQLLTRSESRAWMKAHHLRATFVTLSLAHGKTETWVADRTGHSSSTMINRYRRAARTAAEVGIGKLKPLDKAIPEFAKGTKR